MYKVSVIIPVYNVAPYITRCLESILGNTYKNIEIICVDDGSTDGGLKILYKFAEQDKRILVIHQENGGVSHARNTGLKHATGEYIAFIDADDWVHKQYFEILVHYAQTLQADLVMCDWNRVYDAADVNDADISDVRTIQYRRIRDNDVKDFSVNRFVWARMYRRMLLVDDWFPEELSYIEDRAFNAKVVSHHPGIQIVKLRTALYYYFSRNNSAINTASESDFIKVVSWFLDHCAESDTARAKQLYLVEAFKLSLAFRDQFSVPGDSQNMQSGN